VAGDAGLSSWLVLGPRHRLCVVVLGPRLLFVVLGPRRRWWVVLGPRRQLRVVLLGPRHFSWVEGLGAGRIVRGWWWCALVVPFVNGGGAPSSVFVRRGPRHCHGGPVVARGRGSWVVRVCGRSIRRRPASASCVVSVCCRHVSS